MGKNLPRREGTSQSEGKGVYAMAYHVLSLVKVQEGCIFSRENIRPSCRSVRLVPGETVAQVGDGLHVGDAGYNGIVGIAWHMGIDHILCGENKKLAEPLKCNDFANFLVRVIRLERMVVWSQRIFHNLFGLFVAVLRDFCSVLLPLGFAYRSSFLPGSQAA